MEPHVAQDPTNPDNLLAVSIVYTEGLLGILRPDFRDDEDQERYTVYFAYSADGGEHVSGSMAVPDTRNCPDRPGGNQMAVDRPDGRPIVERYIVGGDYYGLIGRSDGGFLAVWSDGRTGIFQLWSTTIEVRPWNGFQVSPMPIIVGV